MLAAEVPVPQAASSPKARQEPTPPIETEPAYMVANVARDDVLNVRSGPSTEFEVVAELRPGSRGISITGACRSEWCPVQHESTTGWVNRMFLANEEPVVRVPAHRVDRRSPRCRCGSDVPPPRAIPPMRRAPA